MRGFINEDEIAACEEACEEAKQAVVDAKKRLDEAIGKGITVEESHGDSYLLRRGDAYAAVTFRDRWLNGTHRFDACVTAAGAAAMLTQAIPAMRLWKSEADARADLARLVEESTNV